MKVIMIEDLNSIRSDFPIFEFNPKLVYMDSAATSQRPKKVIDKVAEVYTQYNSNVHRGIYSMAEKVTEEYEDARKEIAAFLGTSAEELIFTKNTTESLNLVAYMLLPKLKNGVITITELEHHSNILPWRKVASLANAEIKTVAVDQEGKINEADFEKKISGTSVFSFAHVSNVAGTTLNAKKMIRTAKAEGAITVVDGAQAAPHIKLNLHDMGADFYALSGHKMLGPTGIGILYGNKKLLEDLEPPFSGGEMVKEVHAEGQEWNDVPWKFEPGTPNFAGAIGFGEAVKYLEKIGMGDIELYEKKLGRALVEELTKIDGLEYIGPMENRASLLSFKLRGYHPHDIAAFLDTRSIAVRSGFHCAQPLHEKFGFFDGSARASLYFYNNMEEIESLARALKELVKL
ncbi:MAG: SufS family cysteine desulfurase [Nitrososphaerota archaeon]|nr:SufS family cysteine desulfurase [Nitrososphaerota archaeon]MDG6932652.1 SufS family cysteine desulfurase [Nitrososphaerota archaeon]MDG6936110.1 SufS family cysteine desulfurase [Nitrososphaerota archaeon]MDG6944291.1 SufS family cysteine desulfurase [Nitrososphaerota archaeon]